LCLRLLASPILDVEIVEPMQGVPPSTSAEIIGVLQRAVQAHNKGNLDEAEGLYRLVLKKDESNFTALNMLGILQGQRRNFGEATLFFERALQVNPRSAEACANLGHLYFQQGNLERAAATYARSLAIKPDFALAHSNYAGVLRSLGRAEEALSHCEKALAAQPNFVNALNNRANALFDLQRHQDALADYAKAISLAPTMPQAWLGRGNCLMELSRPVEAQAAYDKALGFAPGFTEAWLGRGNALAALRRHAEAKSAYDKALALDPRCADAWIGLGNVLLALGRYEDAGAAYKQALAVNPNSAKAWLAVATTAQALKRHDEAVAACEKALAIDAAIEHAEGMRFLAKLNTSDWRNLDDDRDRLIAGVNRGTLIASPFVMICATSSVQDQLKCAELFAAKRYPATAPHPEWKASGARDRINVAYVSADFGEHAVSLLTAGLFEHHDRSRFRTIAVSLGRDDRSKLRDRIKSSFETFVDAEARSDSEVVALMRELEVDIAVDLMGFTEGCRTGIFAQRAAAIAVNYLGYPGTMGVPYIDYIIADRLVIPDERRHHYSEKIARLPDTFQVNDSRRPPVEVPPSREECGLPAHAFVFCAFNTAHKITPLMFDIWMRLLKGVEHSVLWLVSNGREVENRLRQEVTSRGVGAERLIFAPRTNYWDYLKRYLCADLFLDTLPFNGGTTVSDALWAGLPVLACSGEAFASRMAGSLLRAVGLPELATASLQDYEGLGLKLASDRAMLADIKARLSANRDSSPLFDTARFCRHIESAFRTMYDRHRRGEPPADFDVVG
jgi:protein O-GlcNAc transferase